MPDYNIIHTADCQALFFIRVKIRQTVLSRRRTVFLDFFRSVDYNSLRSHPGVAQLVARVVWDHDAAGSNPVTRTTKLHRNVVTVQLLYFISV